VNAPTPFSVVIPVAERDTELVPRTLPSWLGLGADDVVIATDKPVSPKLREVVSRVARTYRATETVRIIEVPNNSEYRFHQAFVRRSGFMAARHDAILTGDIDLIVRRNVLRLVTEVASGSVGLASCLRVPAPLNPHQFLRAEAYTFKQRFAPPIFTGLYAMWRPYWRETEDEGIRDLRDPRKDAYRAAGLGIIGEDTYLFVCMRKRYKCLNLGFVGAVALSRNVEDLPTEQFAWGRYMSAKGASLGAVVGASISFAYPHMLRGYVYQRSRKGEFFDPFLEDFKPALVRNP
jgi:hypothetical protein